MDSFNFNTTSNGAQDAITLWDLDCETLCPFASKELRDDLFSDFCRLCDKGYDSVVSLTCDNCWLKNDLMITDMEFVMGLGAVSVCTVVAGGRLSANVDITSSTSATAEFEASQTLLAGPIAGFGFVFDLGFMYLEIGAVWEINAKFSLAVSGTGDASIGADFMTDYRVQLVHTEEGEMADVYTATAETVSRHYHAPSVQLQGGVTAEVALSPTIVFNIPAILELQIAIDPHLSLELNFSYPPYPALPPGQLPADGAPVGAGGCGAVHAAQYGLSLQTDLSSSATLFCIAEWEGAAADVLPPLPLVSGCLVNITSRLATGLFVYATDTVSAFLALPADLDLLATMYASDLAHALAIDTALLRVMASNDSDSVALNVTFFDEDNSYALASAALAVVSDEGSALYGNYTYVGAYLAGELEYAAIDGVDSGEEKKGLSAGAWVGIAAAAAAAVALLVAVGVLVARQWLAHRRQAGFAPLPPSPADHQRW
eukprot:TRINITY_DN3625_c0_g1_i3.p1 TRINITY_DN3625_c0_g1~~TRINITY_DN3625_c0_g1_i3.p1  ORF type:complete len:486 (-),score=123.82 TRINITY_DN3625_c0_g1_i3:83-1540(-)